MRRGFERAVLAVAALAVMAGSADALLVSLDRADIRRALDLAQWPRTDQDRARFHARYLVRVGSAAVGQTSVDLTQVARSKSLDGCPDRNAHEDRGAFRRRCLDFASAFTEPMFDSAGDRRSAGAEGGT